MSACEFLTLVTYDCNRLHEKVAEFLEEKGFKRSSNGGRDLPRNTFLKKEDRDIKDWATINTPSSIEIWRESNSLSDRYKDSLRDFMNENDIDGHIYALSVYEYTSADSVSGKANW